MNRRQVQVLVVLFVALVVFAKAANAQSNDKPATAQPTPTHAITAGEFNKLRGDERTKVLQDEFNNTVDSLLKMLRSPNDKYGTLKDVERAKREAARADVIEDIARHTTREDLELIMLASGQTSNALVADLIRGYLASKLKARGEPIAKDGQARVTDLKTYLAGSPEEQYAVVMNHLKKRVDALEAKNPDLAKQVLYYFTKGRTPDDKSSPGFDAFVIEVDAVRKVAAEKHIDISKIEVEKILDRVIKMRFPQVEQELEKQDKPPAN